MTRAIDREEFAHLMGKEAPRMSFHEVRHLMMLARKLQRLAEEDCNRGLTDKEHTLWDRATAHITGMCVLADCAALIGGDPRGAIVKIVVPSGRTNDWGQEGICVPA